MEWIKKSGQRVTTNDNPDTIMAAMTLGWEEVDEAAIAKAKAEAEAKAKAKPGK